MPRRTILLLTLAALFPLIVHAATLTPAHPTLEHGFTTSQEAQVALDILASLTTGGWGIPEQESAVVELSLDGRFHSHVLVVHQQPLTYSVLLGKLAAGQHRATLRLLAEESRSREGVVVQTLTHRLLAAGSRQEQAAASAPFLYLADYMTHSDLPMMLAVTPEGPLHYTLFFSNEDGGTGTYPPMLMGQWGRMADIEAMMWDQEGRWFYQGPGHMNMPLTGKKVDGRPALSVCTDNGMFCNKHKKDQLRLSLVPLVSVAGTRERMMDEHPWMTLLQNEEMLREKGNDGRVKATPDPKGRKGTLGDARQYLYGDMLCEGEGSVSLLVRLKDTGTVFKSDNTLGTFLSSRDLRLRCGELHRVAVKLPLDITVEQVVSVGIKNHAETPLRASLHHAVVLDRQYRPNPLPPGLTGEGEVPPGETRWFEAR